MISTIKEPIEVRLLDDLSKGIIKDLRSIGVKEINFGRGDGKKEEYALLSFVLSGNNFELTLKKK